MPHWRWVLNQLMRRLWLRATFIGIVGVIAAVVALAVEPYLPPELPGAIEADAIRSILAIIAASMLTVTTFSLSVMISAYGSATSNVTPRATTLLLEDRLSQTVLSTFIGSFLFAIVGIVALGAGVYGDRARLILFLLTIADIVLIVVALLRWIDHLTRLGRVGETTDRVEQATRQAMEARLAAPCFGGRPREDREVPDGARPVPAEAVGYVLSLDMAALSEGCAQVDGTLHVAVLPGTFVYPDTPLAWIVAGPGELPDGFVGNMRRAFTLGDTRSFDQDPRFGLAVLSEIASRAMSPAVNDAGTAIDVIGRMTRLLVLWADGQAAAAAKEEEAEETIAHPHVHVPPLSTADLFEDAFLLLARDGAGLIEVQLRLRKALLALARLGDADFRAAARDQARLALARAEAALPLEDDRSRLRAVPDGQPSTSAGLQPQSAGSAGSTREP